MALKGQTKISANQLKAETDKYLEECTKETKRPLKVELALRLGIDNSTLTHYLENPSHAQSLKKLEQSSEVFLNRRLDNSLSAPNVMFALKAVHGYQEVTKMDFTTNGKDMPMIVLPARVER